MHEILWIMKNNVQLIQGWGGVQADRHELDIMDYEKMIFNLFRGEEGGMYKQIGMN